MGSSWNLFFQVSSARGRPPIHDDHCVLNGILWVLRTGAAGRTPERFSSSSTCYRRFSKWVKAGIFRKILEALARDLEERGAINLSECFIDGTFVVAKKGRKTGKDQAGQRYQVMVIADTSDLAHAHGCPHEVTLVQATLNKIITVGQPIRIIGDRAYEVIRSITPLLPKGLRWLCHIDGIENIKQHKMVAPCGDTAAVGKPNVFSLG